MTPHKDIFVDGKHELREIQSRCTQSFYAKKQSKVKLNRNDKKDGAKDKLREIQGKQAKVLGDTTDGIQEIKKLGGIELADILKYSVSDVKEDGCEENLTKTGQTYAESSNPKRARSARETPREEIQSFYIDARERENAERKRQVAAETRCGETTLGEILPIFRNLRNVHLANERKRIQSTWKSDKTRDTPKSARNDIVDVLLNTEPAALERVQSKTATKLYALRNKRDIAHRLYRHALDKAYAKMDVCDKNQSYYGRESKGMAIDMDAREDTSDGILSDNNQSFYIECKGLTR